MQKISENKDGLLQWYDNMETMGKAPQWTFDRLFQLISSSMTPPELAEVLPQITSEEQLVYQDIHDFTFADLVLQISPTTEMISGNVLGAFTRTCQVPIGALIILNMFTVFRSKNGTISIALNKEKAEALNSVYSRFIQQIQISEIPDQIRKRQRQQEASAPRSYWGSLFGNSGKFSLRRHSKKTNAKKASGSPQQRSCCCHYCKGCTYRIKQGLRPWLSCKACGYVV